MIVKLASTNTEKNEAVTIREKVFVKEQGIPIDIEIDGLDATALHFVGYLNNQPVCASRLRFVDNFGKLERICVLKEFRGHKYGQRLIQAMELEVITSNYLFSRLNAQVQTKAFYETLGYQIVSKPFIEAAILHVTMEKHLNKYKAWSFTSK